MAARSSSIRKATPTWFRARSSSGPESELGWPTEDEKPQEGGWISTFQNGNITFVNGEYGE